MTEYFSTEKSNLNNLISKTSSNDIRRESNSKIQNNTENRKRGLKNREKKQKLQKILNNNNNEKQTNNNGKIIMSTNTDINGNNDHNGRCEYRDKEVNSKSNKTKKIIRRIEIIYMVQTIKHKKIIRKNEVQNSNTTKIMETLEIKIECRAAKETDKQDNYLQTQFKYRNDYNLYSINEDNYNNVSTLQIRKDLKERKLSESILEKHRSGKDESTSTTCNSITIDLKTKKCKTPKGERTFRNKNKNIGIIIRTEREEIGIS